MPRAIALLVALLGLAAVRADASDKLQLANGDELNGVIVEERNDHIILEHPVLGRVELARDQLKAEDPPDDGAFGIGLFRDWQRSFELGLTGSEGNSENMTLRAGLALDYEDELKRWRIDARYLRGSQDGDTDEHEARTLLERDWRWADSPWFLFANGVFDWDQFQDWDFRASLFAGPGYEFYDTEVFTLRGRVGGGVTREFGSGEGAIPEALLGIETDWDPDERQKIAFHNRLFPDLSDFGEFRNVTGLDYTVDVGALGGIKLKSGLENEYDSKVADDIRRNDLKYYGSVLLGF